MENKNIDIGKEEILKIKMTEQEKAQLFENISYLATPIEKPVPSPYFSKLIHGKFFAYSLTLLCLMVLSGGAFLSYFKNQSDKYHDTLVNIPMAKNSESGEIAKLNNQKENFQSGGNNNSVALPSVSGTTLVNPDQANTATGAIPPSITSNDESEKYITIASELFSNWLLDQGATGREIFDYKINKINFIALKETAQEPEKFWFNSDESVEAFLVTVNYSVKTSPEGKMNYWLEGNGQDAPDGWVLNKSLLLTIDKNINGYFIKVFKRN